MDNVRIRPLPYIEREQAIVRYLKDIDDPQSGATVKEIWTAVNDRLSERVSQSAYHKVIDKMVSQHKLEEVDDGQPSRRYHVAPHLFPENAITLDDIYENLWSMPPSDALARFIDALDYFEEKKHTTLKKAAEALRREDPVELVADMILERLAQLNKQLRLWHEPEIQENTLRLAILRAHDNLVRFVCRGLGLPVRLIDLGAVEDLLADPQATITFPPERLDELRDKLRHRIVGDAFIIEVDATTGLSTEELERAVVVGSDGSTHAGVPGGLTAPRFYDDPDAQVITFNNAIAFYEYADGIKSEQPDYPFTGVPMTRAALDDPSNRGMVLAPFMFPELEDSEYEHMKKSATDVVQFRIDERVVTATSRSLGPRHEKLPPATVIVRDGTVVPQEREFHHYQRRDPYGEMVQEGIALSASILSTIITARAPVVYAGAVKFTQVRLYADILNWYIASGSRKRHGKPLDPNWDISRAAHITDTAAIAQLLAALKPERKGWYFCSCVLIRPFFALTTEFARRDIDDDGWVAYFREKRDQQMSDYRKYGGQRPYLDTVSIEGDAYVRMCEDADYAQFYVGHAAGDPLPLPPRYEFLDQLRRREIADLKERVLDKMARIVASIHLTGFSLDREHNYYSDKQLVKILPYVVFTAHEYCKVLGGKLESELKSEVAARLNQLKHFRGLTSGQFTLVPLALEQYLRLMQRKQLPAGDDTPHSDSSDKV